MVKVIALAVAALIVVLVAAIMGAYWWANTPPARPSNVDASAVWLWAPYVGLPGPKRGTWLTCCADSNAEAFRCRLNDKNGVVLYEGAFSPLRDDAHGGYNNAGIDLAKTHENGLDQAVFINGALVPMV